MYPRWENAVLPDVENPLTLETTGSIKAENMDLKTYILKIGRAEAAKLFGVSYPTVCTWASGTRTPKPEHAYRIVARSPVSYSAIYHSQGSKSA